MWLEIICGLVFYKILRRLFGGGDAFTDVDSSDSDVFFAVAARLERIYGGKAFVGLRIPDGDTGSRQHIDVVLVTEREVIVVVVRNLCGYVEIDEDGGWKCTNEKKHKPDIFPDPGLAVSGQVEILESYLEQRGVPLPKGHIVGRIIFPNPNCRLAYSIASQPEVVSFDEWRELKSETRGGLSNWIKGAVKGGNNEAQDELYQKLQYVLSTSPMWDCLETRGDRHILGEFLEFKGNQDDMQALRDLKRSKVGRLIIQKPCMLGLGIYFYYIACGGGGSSSAAFTVLTMTKETQNTSGTEIGSAPTPASLSMGVQQESPSQVAPAQGLLPLIEGQVITEDITSSEQQAIENEVKKRKPCRPPSNAWAHFTREKDRAICRYCKKSYACNDANHGTSNLLKHFKSCEKNPDKVIDKRQKTIAIGKQSEDDPNTSISMKLVDFNQEKFRLALAKMIIVDELPFKFVENQCFKDFMAELQPRFQISSRITIARDCVQLYGVEKEKLKNIFSENRQMVSLTTNTWTSIQNMNYMCVTAHFIYDRWKLHKKVLTFDLIGDHKGETIGKALEICVKDWSILKIGCVTVDNAKSNKLAIAYLVDSMSDWGGTTFLNGEFTHMRCAAHVLNIIVREGMTIIDTSIKRVRTSCKYVKSSPARSAAFDRCVQMANITCTKKVLLDVSTRWNSTYLMLEVAEKYEKAFKRLEHDDSYRIFFNDAKIAYPTSDDWSRVRVFVNFLKVFYDATIAFSGSLHVTSNAFFHSLIDIQKQLKKWRQTSDNVLQLMTVKMQAKFNEYWDDDAMLNYLLFVALFLDPRYKLEYIEFCFTRMYDGDKSEEMVHKLKTLIHQLFEQYKVLTSLDTCDSSNLTTTTESTSHTSRDIDWEDEFRMKVRRKQGEIKRSKLDRYIEDDVEENIEGFDILKWWKAKASKYYILSHMARDVLAIPISTVPSESTFSTGGRVLDPFRSSLRPSTVEALICAQNWLRTPMKVIDFQVEIDETERIEEELVGSKEDSNILG